MKTILNMKHLRNTLFITLLVISTQIVQAQMLPIAPPRVNQKGCEIKDKSNLWVEILMKPSETYKLASKRMIAPAKKEKSSTTSIVSLVGKSFVRLVRRLSLE